MVDEEKYLALLARTEIERDNADLYAELGLMAVEMGRRAESVAFLTRALRLKPSLAHLREPLQKIATPEELRGLEEYAPAKPFAETYRTALRYPWTGHGPYILVAGAVGLGIARAAAFGFPIPHPMARAILAFIFWFIFTGYLWGFLFDVLKHSAKGDTDPPHWPDLFNMFDMAREGIRACGAFIIALLPAVFVLFFHAIALIQLVFFGKSGPEAALLTAAAIPALAYGAFMLPMSLLANGMFNNPVAAFDIVHVLKSIRATWSDYRLLMPTVALLLLVTVPTMELVFFLGSGHLGLLLVYFIPIALMTFVELYSGMVLMRLLGLFFAANQAKLKWFDEVRPD